MWANALVSFNAIAPMFLMIALGWILRKNERLDDETLSRMNSVNYYFFLPCLTFVSAYDGILEDLSALWLAGFCVGGILLEYAVSGLLFRNSGLPAYKRGTVMQSCFRVNSMLIGLPLLRNLYPDIAVATVAYSFTIPLFNVLGIVSCQYECRSKRELALSVIKNPMVFSTLLGILLNLLHVPLPAFLLSAAGSIGPTGSTLALVILGALFTFEGLRENRRMISLLTVLRLVLLPGLFMTAAFLLGFRGIWLVVVLVVFGCPIPPTIFTLAKEMKGDHELAGGAVVVSTVLSLPTLFLLLFLLGSTGLL